jgi:tetratricopeptide (TPR) repeat protein
MGWSIRSGIRALAAAALVLTGAPSGALAAPKDPKEAEARAQFEQAQNDYNLGRFKEALDEYAKAYEIKSLPGFLFNIAQCHRQMHHWERAVFHFKRYLELSPGRVSNEQVVRDLIAECEAKQAEVEQKKATDTAEQHRIDLAKAEAQKAEVEAQAKRDEQARLQREEDERKAAVLAAATLPVGATPSATLVEGPPSNPEPPVYKKWWFWTGVGVVAAGAAGTVTYFQLNGAPTSLPTLCGRAAGCK